MTFNARISAVVDATHPLLEIPPLKPSQLHSNPASRWNAYLNQLCLSAVLPWLQEEFDPQAKAWPSNAAQASFWEVVNGVAITLGDTRFLLVPSEASDLDEMRVPQEWIDIPSWVADYYLAVQIELDDCWARVWGYATHQQLKSRGHYDANDRTYSLNAIADPTVLWVAKQIGTGEATRSAIAPLPALSLPQAENLLQRLGDSSLIFPRLAVPFTLWGALLEHGGWRQQLYQRRLGQPESRSMLQWLREGVSEMAGQLGWQQIALQSAWQGARGEETTTASTVLSRQLAIDERVYELRVLPLNALEAGAWRFELRGAALGGTIPSGFKLRLLSEDLQPFENNEDVAIAIVDRLYVDVAIAPGEGLVWEVEPMPENYEPEILRF
jgi:hypothetical protein